MYYFQKRFDHVFLAIGAPRALRKFIDSGNAGVFWPPWNARLWPFIPILSNIFPPILSSFFPQEKQELFAWLKMSQRSKYLECFAFQSMENKKALLECKILEFWEIVLGYERPVTMSSYRSSHYWGLVPTCMGFTWDSHLSLIHISEPTRPY